MNPDQAVKCIEIINDLWPITAKDPEKGGWSARMMQDCRDRLKPYPYESAEAILSAMRFETGSRVRPDVADLMARLRMVVHRETLGDRSGYDVQQVDTEHKPLGKWKIDFADPDRFEAKVIEMNSEINPSTGKFDKGDYFAKGCRQRWGDDYGRRPTT